MEDTVADRIDERVAESGKDEDTIGEEGRMDERIDWTVGGEVAAAAATASDPCSFLTCFFRSKLRQKPFPQCSHSNGYK